MAARKQKRQKGTNSKKFRNMSTEYVDAYAKKLLEQIKLHLGHVTVFTRDDLQRLPIIEFEQVAFPTRYIAVCTAVAYLIEQGRLIRLKVPDLCLPENAASYRFGETSIREEYGATVRGLVRAMPPGQPFAIMQLVKRWRTDSELTLDSKRRAVRLSMSRIVNEGLCKRVSRFEFVVGAKR